MEEKGKNLENEAMENLVKAVLKSGDVKTVFEGSEARKFQAVKLFGQGKKLDFRSKRNRVKKYIVTK